MLMASKDGTEIKKKKGAMTVFIGFLLFAVGVGVGFLGVERGVFVMIPFSAEDVGVLEDDLSAPQADISEISFIEMKPITISLAGNEGIRHLRFRAQLEVAKVYESEVRKLLPRVVDVLNGYLRALEVGDFQGPSALLSLRGQMLHRVKIATGGNQIRDFLIMDFVLN